MKKRRYGNEILITCRSENVVGPHPVSYIE